MKATRRKFFGLMAVTPFVAKQAAENVAATLSRTTVSGSTLGLAGQNMMGQPVGGYIGAPSKDDWRRAILNPMFRDELKSYFYGENKHVHSIDYDIAVHRSISLAAKIAYQRERNVARNIENLQNEYPWSNLEKRVLGFFRGGSA